MTPWTRRRALAGATGFALTSGPARAQPDAGLARIAARHGLVVGCAVEPEPLAADSAFAALVRAQCSQITAENALKWSALRPAADRFDFAAGDALVGWAANAGLGVYGHCLVWHQALPPWAREAIAAGGGETLLHRHIGAVVGRYRGRIRAWDVVIEAVERADGRSDGLRRSPWLAALGPDYLATAFRLAHAADPHACLALADYGLEYDDEPWMVEKRRMLLALLADLRRSGVPVHALNIQGHLIGGRPPAFGAAFRAFLADVARLGLEIYVGELDVDDRELAGSAADRDQAVAEIYAAFLTAALSQPAVKMVSTWGLSDRYSAKRFLAPRPDGDERPLPFARDLTAKPAWRAMRSALQQAPRRTASLALSSGPRA